MLAAQKELKKTSILCIIEHSTKLLRSVYIPSFVKSCLQLWKSGTHKCFCITLANPWKLFPWHFLHHWSLNTLHLKMLALYSIAFTDIMEREAGIPGILRHVYKIAIILGNFGLNNQFRSYSANSMWNYESLSSDSWPNLQTCQAFTHTVTSDWFTHPMHMPE